MPTTGFRVPRICARCLRVRKTQLAPRKADVAKWFSTFSVHYDADNVSDKQEKEYAASRTSQGGERGALSRRLAQMSEEALETGGRAAQKAVGETVFDEELRKELEERIANANFRNQHATALAEANLPECAGRGTRHIAGARPWGGNEAPGDTALRMLHDSAKPLRVPAVNHHLVLAPANADTGRSNKRSAAGVRVVNARDQSSYYSFMKDGSMSHAEKEQFRKDMKAKFDPGARSLPATLQGMASLANKRIEDAIARGQFKNLPRGMKIERDYNASSPFIDTTEYLLNKMIQKQDIVPPWIEKQQELLSTANKFRARLRNDWKRHAARTIGSLGGSLDSRVRIAQEYAAAETIVNLPRANQDTIHTAGSQGQVSQISLAGELKAIPNSASSLSEVENKVTEVPSTPTPSSRSELPSAAAEIEIMVSPVEDSSARVEPQLSPAPFPFRDPQWLAAERSFLSHSIDNLNSLARSYNLMAPDLAKKPYYSLDRELNSMYRDVAPQVADAIRERATTPRVRVGLSGGQAGSGILAALGAGEKTRVFDENKAKRYGLKEFWKDLFAKDK